MTRKELILIGLGLTISGLSPKKAKASKVISKGVKNTVLPSPVLSTVNCTGSVFGFGDFKELMSAPVDEKLLNQKVSNRLTVRATDEEINRQFLDMCRRSLDHSNLSRWGEGAIRQVYTDL